MIRSGSLELVLKRVLSENIDAGGIALCLRVLQHASFSAATFDEENDNEGEEALEEEHASSIKIREAAAMVKNATLLKYNGVLVFEKLFSLLFTPGRSTDSALTLSNRVKIELRDAYLAAVTNFILESDEFKRCICTASKNSGETSIFNRLVSFLFREKEKTTRLRDPLSFAEEKFIPSITMARGVKLLSSLSTFSLTRAQLSRSVFIEKCCEMIARFSISGTASTKNRSRVDLKIECDAAIDALCVLSGSDEDGAKLLLRSCKINIIGLLVDCYEHADNIFDETVHDENEIDDAADDEKDEDEATPSSFLLTKRKLLLLFHNLSFAGDVAKAHFCAKTKSLDVLIESIENSFDAESALLGSAALLSLARRGARVLAALRRGDREERLRRCSHVLGERVAFLNASSTSSLSSSNTLHNRSARKERRRRKEFKMLAGALKRLSEILKAFEHSESSLS
jgi:hypothetical protein